MSERIDEVSKYYNPAKIINFINKWIFIIIAIYSLVFPFLMISNIKCKNLIQSLFIVIVISYFVLSQVLRFYLIPYAEKIRRKQMLSDAFDINLVRERTNKYYNNDYSPSLNRLAANTMENSFFSKSVIKKMLCMKRTITGIYLIVWIFLFSYRHTNIDTMLWITQVIFSSEILVQWLNLEILRYRYELVYQDLYNYFLYRKDEKHSNGIASILDAFVAYESSKSAGGQLLSTKVFNNLNSELTEEWNSIRDSLNIGKDDK